MYRPGQIVEDQANRVLYYLQIGTGEPFVHEGFMYIPEDI